MKHINLANKALIISRVFKVITESFVQPGFLIGLPLREDTGGERAG